MKQKASIRPFQLLVCISFLGFALWWLYITVFLRTTADHNSINNQAFGATYGVIALFGGIAGLVASKKWGGRKSILGRALLFFALGLLAQEFGQITYSFYTYVLKVAIPYPSVGDVGYFGSVLLYIYAVFQLSKVVGVRFSLKDRRGKLIAIILPLALLIISYVFFLKDYQFDWSHPLTIFLDFGYPLGQALYIAIALLTYILSRRLLGGVMKNRVLFVLLALVVQYAADFSFLYAARNDKPFPGGANDFMYLCAYTVMALALSSFLTLSLTANKGQPDEPQPETT